MRFFLLLFALIMYTDSKSQNVKILLDQTKPISGHRVIVTDALSIFKMKSIRIAAMIETGVDTTYSIAYYMKNLDISCFPHISKIFQFFFISVW